MTDEQNERAARVWREACAACEDNSHDLTLSIRDRTLAGDQAAAAVIAADRAGLVAEIERLREENTRLRQHIANTANQINIAGSAYDRAVMAMEELVLGVKREARAALKEPSHEHG